MAYRPPCRPERDAALELALSPRLAVTEIAEALGVSRAAVSQWRRVPERHVAIVARITGISKRRLRPDLFPVRQRMAAE
jgi:pyruvate kinase